MCGTAAVISPVGEVQNGDETIVIGEGLSHVGPHIARLRETLVGIQQGEVEDSFNWVEEIIGQD